MVKGSRRAGERVMVGVRVPKRTAVWLDREASRLDISRNAFLARLLKELEVLSRSTKPGGPSGLFAHLLDDMDERLARALERARANL